MPKSPVFPSFSADSSFTDDPAEIIAKYLEYFVNMPQEASAQFVGVSLRNLDARYGDDKDNMCVQVKAAMLLGLGRYFGPENLVLDVSSEEVDVKYYKLLISISVTINGLTSSVSVNLAKANDKKFVVTFI